MKAFAFWYFDWGWCVWMILAPIGGFISARINPKLFLGYFIFLVVFGVSLFAAKHL